MAEVLLPFPLTGPLFFSFLPLSSICVCRSSGRGSNGGGDAGLVHGSHERGLAALLGVSVLLCAMILDDRRDAAARVLALRGGGGHGD